MPEGANVNGVMNVQGKLIPVEKVRLDNAHLEKLYAQLGSVGAEDFISRTMEDLAVQLAKLRRCQSAGGIADVRQIAGTIAALADQIGMSMVSRVARDVAKLSTRNDGTAFEATVARLGRVGETSLMAVWDMQGLSG